MESLILYRDAHIPELRRIIGGLPNHGILRDGADALEVAINRYIDVIAPGGSPAPMNQQNNGNRGRSPSFQGLNVNYDPEAAAWGGARRRSKRSKRSKRGTRRR
jgi:hypothetical protein